MADTEKEFPYWSLLGTLPFRGRRLVLETVTALLGNRTGQTVLFGGLSAGGRGSMVIIDPLRQVVDPSNSLMGIHDSGDYVELTPLNPTLVPFTEQCHRAYSFFNKPAISDKCGSAYSNESWKCICGEFMLPLVQVPSQIIIHQFDSYQLSLNLDKQLPKDWTNEDCLYANNRFRPLILRSVGQIVQEGTFLPLAIFS